MKKINSLILVLLAMVATVSTGCKQSMADMEDVAPQIQPQIVTLIATTGGDDSQTKISFEDGGATGVKLTWSEGDMFTLYKPDGNRLGNFKLESGAGTNTGVFKSVGTVTMETGTNYTAIYPVSGHSTLADAKKYRATSGFSEQSTGINHLDGMCLMISEFDFTSGDDINDKLRFKHDYSILTVNMTAPAGFPSGEKPIQLTMHDNNHQFFSNVQLTQATDWSSAVTVQMMMTPTEGERDLVFCVITDKGNTYTTTLNTNKTHVAGKRYTATIPATGKSWEAVETMDLTEMSKDAYPNVNTWVITSKTGATDVPDQALTADNFAGLCAALAIAAQNGKKIEVIMPNIIKLPFRAFNRCASLSSISLPGASSIGNQAFLHCTSLSSISFPGASSIGEYAFSGCTSLSSISLPNATSIGVNAFQSCTSLSSISLPNATSIGQYAFQSCTSLSSISLPNAILIEMSAFFACASLSSVSLPVASSIKNYVFEECTSLNSISLPNAATIGQRVFLYCTSLTKLEIATGSAAALTGVGTGLFDDVTTSNIELAIGSLESKDPANDELDANKWRGCGPFKSITVK